MMHPVIQTAMTDPLSSPQPAPSNSLLDLNLTMNLNPEDTVHNDMYNVKYRQPDTLYGPILFKQLKQIKVSCTMFEVTSFIDCGPNLKSFSSLKRYIKWLEEQLTDIITNPSHKIVKRTL